MTLENVRRSCQRLRAAGESIALLAMIDVVEGRYVGPFPEVPRRDDFPLAWETLKFAEVFVRPFPDVNGGKWQVSSGGGSAPLWAHNGRELFYVSGTNMYVVQLHPGPPFSAEPPRVLFAIPDRVRQGALVRGTFAITPDDQRFLMVRDKSWEDMAGTPTMVVVENFFEELRAKLKK